MKKIFICYMKQNYNEAIEYFNKVSKDGYTIWFEPLTPQRDGWKIIQQNIKDAELVLCLLSKECLLDNWMYNQISYAKSLQKKIVYIQIDQTNLSEFKEYEIEEAYSGNVQNLNIDSYFMEVMQESFFEKQRIARANYNFSFFLFGVMSILTIYTLCYGLRFMNMSLSFEYGYVLLGLDIILLLSMIPRKGIYIFNCFLSLTVLGFSVLYLDPFYITDISVNPIFFLVFFFLIYFIRYSSHGFLPTLFKSIFYTVFFISLYIAITIFIKYFFDLDFSAISVLFVTTLLIYLYFKLDGFFKQCQELRCMKKDLKNKGGN